MESSFPPVILSTIYMIPSVVFFMKRVLQISVKIFQFHSYSVRMIQLHGWVICQCEDAPGDRPGRICAADGILGRRGSGASQVRLKIYLRDFGLTMPRHELWDFGLTMLRHDL